jgi:imidazolonepropionase-like amidohydrolase
VLPAEEILTSATRFAADIVGMGGKLGIVADGALADLIVVDGDPLADLTVLTGQGEAIAAIMQAGRLVKNRLS